MAYQFANSGNSNVYYTLSYDHHHSSDINHHHYQQNGGMGQSYFNNCASFLNRTNQQTTTNFPMRIDMNMTAYVRPPPQLTSQDLFYETAQLPIAGQLPHVSSTGGQNATCADHLLEHSDYATTTERCFSPQDIAGQHHTHHLNHWTYLQHVKTSSVSVNGTCIGDRKNLANGVKSEFDDVINDGDFSEKTEIIHHTTRKQTQQSGKNVAKFQCFLCGKKYCRQSTLKAHLRQHSGEKPYVCNICGKNFSQSANLNAHKRVHTGEKPFTCPICCRPFSQSSSLMTHKRTHSGERPYRCTSCDKAFTDSSTLTKHIRTHTGCKPYACRICHFSFSQSGNLSRHMKTHLKRQETQQVVGFIQQ